MKFIPGQYKVTIGISVGNDVIQYIDSDIYLNISDVVYMQEKNIKNHKSGFLLNQMEINIHNSNN